MAILINEVISLITFQNANRRRVAHGCDERLHDGRACTITGHAHDTLFRVGRFLGEHIVSRQIAIEWHAIFEEIANAVWSFAGDKPGNCFVNDAVAGCDGIDGVFGRAIAFADGGGNATLRPHA